jgi:hypothetical protein
MTYIRYKSWRFGPTPPASTPAGIGVVHRHGLKKMLVTGRYRPGAMLQRQTRRACGSILPIRASDHHDGVLTRRVSALNVRGKAVEGVQVHVLSLASARYLRYASSCRQHITRSNVATRSAFHVCISYLIIIFLNTTLQDFVRTMPCSLK